MTLFKRLLALLALTVLFVLPAALAEEAPLPLTMLYDEVQLAKGKSIALDYTLPEGLGKPTKVRWTTSDKAVVSVSRGQATGGKPGEAVVTVTLTFRDGTRAEGSTRVDVFQPVSSLQLDKRQLSLQTGETHAFAVTVKPASARFTQVTWSTSDPAVATVDESGCVTAVGPGSAKITATSREPVRGKSKPRTAVCTVKVTQPVTAIAFEQTEMQLFKGRTLKLSPRVLPENASRKKLRWTSSDKKIATVAEGRVQARQPGTVTITATAQDGSGVSAAFTLTVTQPVTGLTSQQKTLSVTEGNSAALTVTVKPQNATDSALLWHSSDEAVATVDESGVVTGVKEGVCTVTASARDGSGKELRCTVTVEPRFPLEAAQFSHSDKDGEFAVTFHNHASTRTVCFIDFTLCMNYGTTTPIRVPCYTDTVRIRPGESKQVGWWKSEDLASAANFTIFLSAVGFTDGAYEFFYDDPPLIGGFQ